MHQMAGEQQRTSIFLARLAKAVIFPPSTGSPRISQFFSNTGLPCSSTSSCFFFFFFLSLSPVEDPCV